MDIIRLDLPFQTSLHHPGTTPPRYTVIRSTHTTPCSFSLFDHVHVLTCSLRSEATPLIEYLDRLLRRRGLISLSPESLIALPAADPHLGLPQPVDKRPSVRARDPDSDLFCRRNLPFLGLCQDDCGAFDPSWTGLILSPRPLSSVERAPRPPRDPCLPLRRSVIMPAFWLVASALRVLY